MSTPFHIVLPVLSQLRAFLVWRHVRYIFCPYFTTLARYSFRMAGLEIKICIFFSDDTRSSQYSQTQLNQIKIVVFDQKCCYQLWTIVVMMRTTARKVLLFHTSSYKQFASLVCSCGWQRRCTRNNSKIENSSGSPTKRHTLDTVGAHQPYYQSRSSRSRSTVWEGVCPLQSVMSSCGVVAANYCTLWRSFF